MKKILIVFAVLAMASAANAALYISVNGRIDLEDTDFTLAPSESCVIDITGDGQTNPGAFYMGIDLGSTGAGSLNIDNATLVYAGSQADIYWEDYEYIANLLNVENPFVHVELTDIAIPPLPLDGLLVDDIVFHCEGIGDVTIALYDENGYFVDSQVIHQVPEPMTFALLGLGGLFLRRRK